MGRKTPLFEEHIALGARMVDFGGWDMPLAYASQIEEHHAVRTEAGLFDVSHMTVVDLYGSDSRGYLSWLLANDVAKLKRPGKALYGCMLNESGGVIDDLITYWQGEDRYRLVVNAATRATDLAWMQEKIQGRAVEIRERGDLAMVALQGPASIDMLDPWLQGQGLDLPRPFAAVENESTFVARTGYTGEDGVEIIVPNEGAAALWRTLLAAGATAAGLGARDTLRLEAGLNLYGSDMTTDVSPLVCGLEWTVAIDDEREFIGREALIAERAAGVAERQVGLVLEGRGVIRSGQPVVTDVGPGIVTSGSFSPTLKRSIALARVPTTASSASVELRGKAMPVRIVVPPFVRHGEIKI